MLPLVSPFFTKHPVFCHLILYVVISVASQEKLSEFLDFATRVIFGFPGTEEENNFNKGH